MIDKTKSKKFNEFLNRFSDFENFISALACKGKLMSRTQVYFKRNLIVHVSVSFMNEWIFSWNYFMIRGEHFVHSVLPFF